MTARSPAVARPRHSLAALALRQLLAIGHGQLSAADEAWLGGVLAWAAQSEPLSQAELCRVSAIRGRLARLYHFTAWMGNADACR